MSYDVSLTISTGNSYVQAYSANITCNAAPMLSEAIGGMRSLCGIQASIAQSIIVVGIRDMFDSADKYRKLAPANGWGSYDQVLTFLRELQMACEEHPLCIVNVY